MRNWLADLLGGVALFVMLAAFLILGHALTLAAGY
jgi:hypothetical protein